MKHNYYLLLLFFKLFLFGNSLYAIDICNQASDECIDIAIASPIINADGSQTYQFEVTNNCNKALSHVAFALPSGERAISPIDNSTYTAINCNYHIENTTNNPFYSIKFEATCADGIKNGGREIFRYTLPADAELLDYIEVSAKASNKTYAVRLATCEAEDDDSNSSTGGDDDDDDTDNVCDHLSAGEISVDGSDEISLCLGDADSDVLTFEVVGQSDAADYAFVIVNEKGIIEGGFGGTEYDFSSATLGICHVYGAAYYGDLIAMVGQKITTVVATGCAEVSINAVTIIKEVVPNCGFDDTPPNDDSDEITVACDNLNAGTVTANGSDEISLCLGDASSDVVVFSVIDNSRDTDYAFVIVNEKGIIQGGFAGLSYDFSDAPLGICYVYGVAYMGDLIAMVDQKITTVVATGCAEVSISSVKIIKEVVPNCGFVEDNDIVVDDCVIKTYDVCTAPIVPIEICPEFCLTGDYEIIEVTTGFHCNLTIDGGCIIYRSIPSFKGKDVIEAVACDLTGKCDTTWIKIRVSKKCPDACQAKAGRLKAEVKTVCSTEQIEAIVSAAPTVPEGGSVFYLLTAGEHYTLHGINDTPQFGGLEIGTYRIHSLVLAPNSLDVNNFVMGETTIFDIHQELEQGSGFICGALWLNGAKFHVEACDVENPCQPQIQRACVQNGGRVKICPRFCLENDYWIEWVKNKSGNKIKILKETCIRYTAKKKKFLGADQVYIKACDKQGNCETAYIEVTVSKSGDCDNDPPIAQIDERTTTIDTPIIVDVLSNDSDPNGDPFQITSFNKRSVYKGKITKSGDKLMYTPKKGFVGMDDFSYQICDIFDACVTAQVWISVEDGPCDNVITTCTKPQKRLKVCPNFCTLSDDYVINNVQTNFKSSIQLTNNEQCIRYTPLKGFKGAETIMVEACDANTCETARINVFVNKNCNQGNKTSDELEQDQALQFDNIFPIPAIDFVQLSFSATTNNVQMSIYNLSGQLLNKQMLNTQGGTNLHRLNVSDYPTGMYFIQLAAENTTINTRFIKR